MSEERKKTGNGEFWLRVNDDRSVDASIFAGGNVPSHFDTVEAAHNHYRTWAEENASFWNLAYHLEDFRASAQHEGHGETETGI